MIESQLDVEAKFIDDISVFIMNKAYLERVEDYLEGLGLSEYSARCSAKDIRNMFCRGVESVMKKNNESRVLQKRMIEHLQKMEYVEAALELIEAEKLRKKAR